MRYKAFIFLALLLIAPSTTPLQADDLDSPKARAPDLYRIWVDKKVGFIDKTGRVVIEPQFSWAYEFSEGLCQVALPDKQGYIDTSGKLVIEIDTHDDHPFRCGVAVVRTGKKTGILDRTGRFIDCPFDLIDEFSEGLAAVGVYEKPAHEKSALFWRQSKWGFVDTQGKLVTPIEYTAARSFSEGLAPVYVGGSESMCLGPRGGKWGYVNRRGEMALKPQFATATSFSEGLALVSRDGGSYGWIDKTGKFAFDAMKLRAASSFHEGVAWIVGEKLDAGRRLAMGYVTKDGKVVFHPAFHRSVGPVSEGLVVGQGTEGLGYLDLRGNWVIEPRFSRAEPFRGALALVAIEGKNAYIDKTGRVIWSAVATR
ncbi:MAG TPA: WG repeat-containing protein [Pirellulaceae bacterium]|nr:WG repeat-containing protein [Pirellulaceae bacterium]